MNPTMGPASTAEDLPGPGADGPWIGRSLRRREDQALLRGEGSFVANIRMAGMAYLAMLRSPVAHGRLGSIDVTAARAAPGVIGVMTARDVAEADPMPVTSREGARLAPVPIPLLARGRVRFVGEPVAAVVAETRACAADALERIDVDYEPLPALLQPRQAAGSGVVLHDGIDDNVLLRWARSAGDAEERFRSATTIRGRFHVP